MHVVLQLCPEFFTSFSYCLGLFIIYFLLHLLPSLSLLFLILCVSLHSPSVPITVLGFPPCPLRECKPKLGAWISVSGHGTLHKTGVVEIICYHLCVLAVWMSFSFLELVIELRFSFLSSRMEYIEGYIKVRVVFR